MKSGLAEIFGTELVKGKSYTFYCGAKIAVFTWQGCTLKLHGKKGISYIAKETPMVRKILDVCRYIKVYLYVSNVLIYIYFFFS